MRKPAYRALRLCGADLALAMEPDLAVNDISSEDDALGPYDRNIAVNIGGSAGDRSGTPETIDGAFLSDEEPLVGIDEQQVGIADATTSVDAVEAKPPGRRPRRRSETSAEQALASPGAEPAPAGRKRRRSATGAEPAPAAAAAAAAGAEPAPAGTKPRVPSATSAAAKRATAATSDA